MAIKDLVTKIKSISLKEKIVNYASLEEAIKGIFLEIKKKENIIIRTNTPENNTQKVFTAKGALDLLNKLTTQITTAIDECKRILRIDIAKKQNKSDSTLITVDKTIVGGINENANKLKKMCTYRIGDILTTENKEHPALTWQGTTWKKIEAAFLRGTESGQEAGIIGGSNTVTLKIGNLPAHNHPISVILGNSGIHRHKVDNHIHSNIRHKHSLGANVVTETGSGAIGGVGSHGNIFITETQLGGGENTGGATPFTDNQGNHNHTVTANSSNIGSGEAINILPRYYTVHYWKRVS